MSDVSKTNELIAEARERAPYGRGNGDLLLRLADALEAATRVPVQGESNDDRETLRKEFEYRIRTAVAYGSGLGYRELPVQERADWIQREIRNAVAIASRATVHDAEIAAKAWGEGWSARASRGYAHLKVGECVPPPAHINPYRKAVQP